MKTLAIVIVLNMALFCSRVFALDPTNALTEPLSVTLSVENAFSYSSTSYINDQVGGDQYIYVKATVSPAWIGDSHIDWSGSDAGISAVPGCNNKARLSRAAWCDFKTAKAKVTYNTSSVSATTALAVFKVGITSPAEHHPLTLKHNSRGALSVDIYPESIGGSSYKIEMKKCIDQTYTTISTRKVEPRWVFRVAGYFDVKGIANISGTDFDSTNYASANLMAVQFPSSGEIIQDMDFALEAAMAWVRTLESTVNNSRREEGFWVELQTDSEKYFRSHSTVGPSATNGATARIPFYLPRDSIQDPRPLDRPIYYVANFHTHTPTFFTNPPGRGVGPSGQDLITNAEFERPGIVYDYIGTTIIGNKPGVPNGHPIDSSAKMYETPPERRPIQ